MQTIIISTKSGNDDLEKYGKDLLDQLKNDSKTVDYEEIADDFSNIKELFNEEEKLVLFNHFSHPEKFIGLTKHLKSFKNIKYIISPYSTYAGLDLDLVKSLGIKYRNNAGANAKSVAQLAIMEMFLVLTKYNLFSNLNEMPEGNFLGEEFYGKTAGIIGMGNIGQELVKILNGLGIKVEYFNRSEKNVDGKLVTLEQVFNNDLIFVTIATTEETKKLLSNFSDLIKPQNYIIDITAIDELYNKKKVIDLIKQNKFQGYAVESETLLDLKDNKTNLIITPHMAWATVDAEQRTVRSYLERALNILEGREGEVDFIV